MGKVLRFHSCAVGGEWTGFGSQTPTTKNYIGIPNAATNVPAAYASDPNLSGKVSGIGNGWQRFVVPSAGKIQFTVRGAAGGNASNSNFSVNPDTGAVSGTGNRPGRGAKLQGEGKFKKGDILYLLVGMRGWCNTWQDWGGGGGGASVVLRDNPSGNYTFAPLNRKVDALFVAGGGGGTYDNATGSTKNGKDAVVTNGTSTGGGSGSKAGGGAGLTGNGGSSNSNGVAYNLLSGSVPTNTFTRVHDGGWGGGGASYNGGGGGGGYTGGSTNDTIGGNGGTSYINPNIITETFRGYATVSDDCSRNLTNPWTAYGHIELVLGRDESKYILVEDDGIYKWFDGEYLLDGTQVPGATNMWVPLPDDLQKTPEPDVYESYGNTVITNADGIDGKVKFLISSMEPSEYINISANADKTLLVQSNTISLSDISIIKSIAFKGNLTNLDVRFAISKDQGYSWQTYNSGSWDSIDIKDRDSFAANGYQLNMIDAIPIEDWNSYHAKTINFAFIITQNGDNGNTIIDSISIVGDLLGSWRHFKESEATYEYISDTEMRITFLQDGNYKVNYLDSLEPSNSGDSTDSN